MRIIITLGLAKDKSKLIRLNLLLLLVNVND